MQIKIIIKKKNTQHFCQNENIKQKWKVNTTIYMKRATERCGVVKSQTNLTIGILNDETDDFIEIKQ